MGACSPAGYDRTLLRRKPTRQRRRSRTDSRRVCGSQDAIASIQRSRKAADWSGAERSVAPWTKHVEQLGDDCQGKNEAQPLPLSGLASPHKTYPVLAVTAEHRRKSAYSTQPLPSSTATPNQALPEHALACQIPDREAQPIGTQPCLSSALLSMTAMPDLRPEQPRETNPECASTRLTATAKPRHACRCTAPQCLTPP